MKLSATMQECLEFCEKQGGVIHRHPGGFWAHKDWTQWKPLSSAFGTSTVEALVSRRHLVYTEWQEGRNGRFPIAAAVVQAQAPGNEATGTNSNVCPS